MKEYEIIGVVRVRTTAPPEKHGTDVHERVEGALLSEFLLGMVEIEWSPMSRVLPWDADAPCPAAYGSGSGG